VSRNRTRSAPRCGRPSTPGGLCVDEADNAPLGAEARCAARPPDKGARLAADPNFADAEMVTPVDADASARMFCTTQRLW